MNKKIKSTIIKVDKDQLKDIVGDIIDFYFDNLYKENIKYDYKIDVFNKKGVKDVSLFIDLIKSEIFDKAIYKSNPKYMKFIDNGISSMNVISATINSLLNQNLTAHLTDSPGATINEISLLNFIRKKVGFKYIKNPKGILDIGGYFTSGGMMGNMAAVLIARNNIIPESQKNGVREDVKLIVPSFASHYSTWNAMGWLGLGENNVIHVKTNNFKYDLINLEDKIFSLKKKNIKILAVILSLGDPYSMSIDNIKGVRKICDKYNIWMHGDGANGGVLIFSNKFKNTIKGINLCDSVSLDPHKALGLNYPNSIFLCKDINNFNKVISHWNIINRADSLDLGATTPFLNSRGFDSLKLWLMLKYYGEDGLGKIVDNKLDTIKFIYKQLLGCKNILLWNVPDTFSILFQIKYKDFDVNSIDFKRLDEFQIKFKKDLEEKTGIKIHSFRLPVDIRYNNLKLNLYDTEVLSIQYAHEDTNKGIINSLIKFIKKY